MAEYEALDLAEIQSEYDRVSAEPGTFQNEDYLEKFVKLPERDGYVIVRILPRKKGGKLCGSTRVHTLNDPSQRDQYGKPKKKTYHCPKVLVKSERNGKVFDTWKGDCIICKYYSDLWQKSEERGISEKQQELLQNQARAIKPVERYYFNVIVRAEKDKEGVVHKNVGPKIYSCGKTVYAKIMRAIVGDETAGEKELGDISHPVNGFDFRIVKKVVRGANGQEYPNYDGSKFEASSPLGTGDEVSNWLETMTDLQSLRVLKTTDELKQALRIHLGMAKSAPEAEEDHDLDEFRGVSGNTSPVSQSQSTASDVVREELTASTTPVSSGEDDLLADDDFMKELGSM